MARYTEAAAIVVFESGAVALTINDDRLLIEGPHIAAHGQDSAEGWFR